MAEGSRLQGGTTDSCAPGFRASERATSHAPPMAREAAGTSTINFAKAERKMRRKTRKSMNFDALWHKMRQLRQSRDAENARFDELLHAVSQMTRYEGAPDFRGAEVDLRRRRSRPKRGGARVRRAKRLRAAHQETTGVEPQGEASPCSQEAGMSRGQVASVWLSHDEALRAQRQLTRGGEEEEENAGRSTPERTRR